MDVSPLPPVASFDAMQCPLPLRRHQREALDAVARARTAGATRWWVTMPPGAGKTLVGTEVARELGRRTVVLSPNTAVQGQWVRAWEAYAGPRAGRRRDLTPAFTSLTYQSLAVFDDDGPDERGPGRRGTLQRLHPNGQALVDTMRAAGPLTLVLDECHHLLEVWGELLREVLDQLPQAVVLGLTATPPAAMTRAQEELTATLFGPVLYEARIPALVKEGTLAPYAELAWLVTPTPEESTWLAEQSERFAELTTDLFEPSFGSTSFPAWLASRYVEPVESGTTTWTELATREPEASDAALRLVDAGLLALPPGAHLREAHRRAPSAEDWTVLLDDWLLHSVVPGAEGAGDDAVADTAVLAAVRRALPSIGKMWTKNGIRTGRGTVDQVTARSAAKEQGVVAVLGAEQAALGVDTRALVLCDHERAAATTHRRLSEDETSAPEPAGSAVGVLLALLSDPGTAALEPLLVTGRIVGGRVRTLRALSEWVGRTHPGLAGGLTVDTSGPVPTLTGRWDASDWVGHVTSFYAAGGTRALVGTRGLLGEGWDAPAITTLVDLTTATTSTAVVQTRGRALRTDPSRPDKVALIWTVVCVFEGHVAGDNDWGRFARKHQGYFTVDERGAVVDGVGGISSRFSPYAPPPVTAFDELDASMLVRAEHRDEVRDAWSTGTGYQDRVQHVLRVRSTTREPGASIEDEPSVAPAELVPWATQIRSRPGGGWAVVPLGAGLVAALASVVGLGTWWLLLVPFLLILASALWGRSRLVAASRHPATVGLVAAAVADGLHRAGLSSAGVDSLRARVQPDGSTAYSLDGVDEDVSARYAEALEEVLAPMSGPRYVLPRWVVPPPRGVQGLVRGLRTVRGDLAHDVEGGEVWHTVPRELARDRAKANAFAAAWDHWVGGGPAVLASSPEGAGVLATHRGLDPFAVTTVVRRVWT